VRKRELGKLLRWSAQIGLKCNDHIAEPDDVVFRHACKMGLEGIVSKRKDSPYPQRPFARLAQEQEPGLRSGAARGRGGLGTMTHTSTRAS
jgi:hypothetical protein